MRTKIVSIFAVLVSYGLLISPAMAVWNQGMQGQDQKILGSSGISSDLEFCETDVAVEDICCIKTTSAWYFNTSKNSWEYDEKVYTVLFKLNVDGVEYDAYCVDYEVPLKPGDTFEASIYRAQSSCKNNSIAYILNNWPPSCSDCSTISAAQAAIWYLWFINDSFCSLGKPEYQHNTIPPIESQWIPSCTVHPEACAVINESINKSVPYRISTFPSTGTFAKGETIELKTTVDYCLEAVGAEVTVVWQTDNAEFENGLTIFENETVDGIARTTFTCNADTANVTARVKNMKWFEIVEPCGEYQKTLSVINITDDAKFSFLRIAKPGTVNGCLYIDNCNCSFDFGEEGVPGVTVELVNISTGLVADTTMTDNNGYYNFTVFAGNYKVYYIASTLPLNLIPKCDDDSEENNSSSSFHVPEEGSHRHNFAVKKKEIPEVPAVPAMTPIGIAVLIGLLISVALLGIRKKK